MKHHFIHLSRHPSIHSSSHPSVASWSVYSDGVEKEWNTDAARQRIIYISVVNFLKIIIIIIKDSMAKSHTSHSV
jgi:hypothetical protein